MKKFHLVFRLFTSVYLVLGLLGYSLPAQASDPPPPIEETSLPDAINSSPNTLAGASALATSTTPPPSNHTIYLKSREFQPDQVDLPALRRAARAERERVHILVQLDMIPREEAKAALEASGLELLEYVPDYAWIASAPAADPAAVLRLPGVTWAGELGLDDKLDPAIRDDHWGEWNLAPDGTAAVNVFLHGDESLAAGRALAAAHGGRVSGEAQGIQMLVVELPKANIPALAAEEAVQWIEPTAPAWSANNDGIRPQIGVDALQASPYNLDGTGIDVLVYDSGQAGNHVDFGTRLIHGDTDDVHAHSTHVAGIVGGDGSNSAAQGGSALQWRGMAPNVDLFSYGTNYSGSGVMFYENVPDIEHDWAQAQNWYGADLGTASVGSNIYDNYYPASCNLMGNYGSAAVLIDQIVRGGNPTVGTGDRYIATWAAGNERGWGTSCAGAGGGYGLVAPPAAAKNPIHVGGANTNNNTQYAHTSWGPTDDGRLKPIVTAGACQTNGDLGVTSTDNSPVDDYTVMCGTSMATPAVAGGIALMLQHYRAVYNVSSNFWPSTAKAILIQTARDFGNTGPDYQWGYGLVNIQAAVDLISRKAFRQESIDDDEVDVYYFIAPDAGQDVRVSLAWDDYEATLNANPTLINNLDLELVSPSGTVWRPWVLNSASPANAATRGLDNRNNQEQVQVSAADESKLVGTWLVRVKGTTVPQGPQSYSLACEGCKPLDVGVCQSEVAGTMMAARLPEGRGPEIESSGEASPTAGEAWQRALEVNEASELAEPETQLQATLAALGAARVLGPQAVVALGETLPPDALEAVIDEIVEAREREEQTTNLQIGKSANADPRSAQISEADEAATLAAQQAAETAARAQALAELDDPQENSASPASSFQLRASVAPAADLTVGEGCTYATIGAAVAAASPGDVLLIEGGRTFTENVTIPISLTLQGGYAGCASGSSTRTTIDGNASGSVVIVNDGLEVTLRNLNLTNGNSGMEGGGLRFALGNDGGTLTLANVHIYTNTAQWGGGVWVGPNADVVGTNVHIYNNAANDYGGGLRLYGSRATLSSSGIHDNSAAYGGGVYASREEGYAPELNLSFADVHDNEALSGGGLGGGIYMRQGSLSLANDSDLISNEALQGGGTYLLTTTLTLNGSGSWIYNNAATGDGGGVYAQGSALYLEDGAELYNNDAGDSGGGAYLDDSNLYGRKASVRYNTAANYGGGLYATNTSRVDMRLTPYACLGVRCSRLYGNTATNSYGGGVYANASPVYLYNVFVENNTGTLGGGLYATGSAVYAYNSLFARNNATGSAGDGIRLYDGASMTGSGNTLAYNNAGGASTGRAIDAWDSILALSCSIVWGHTSSIDPSGQNVTYSDVQGGYAGTGNLDTNPLFVASGSSDYHLQSTSPLVDRCSSGSGTDMDNEIRPIVRTTGATPYDVGADEVSGAVRVGINGGGCAYATLQQAVDAADSGDTLQAASGVYFENVNITDKAITIEGGYDSTCTSYITTTSRIEGSAGSGSTLDVAGGTVWLRNLQVAWGSGIGGGVDAYNGAQVTLDNTDVVTNHGSSGAGIYISADSALTATNGSEIYANTATSNGGGAYVVGKLYAYGNASITRDNCAANGGGFYVGGGQVYLNNARAYRNQAAAADGKGGGIYVLSNGVVTLTNGAYVYFLNQAYDGGGIYADRSTIFMSGLGTTLRDNVASHYGGAMYLANDSALYGSGRIGQAGSVGIANEAARGAGLYVEDSTVDFSGYIQNNIASGYGAGIYATGSQLRLENATVGGDASNEINQLGPSGYYGAGLYLYNTHAELANTVVASNTFQAATLNYGGGAYVRSGSVVTLTNSRVENHLATATSGYGAGLYVYGSSVTLDNSQIVSNTAHSYGGGVRLAGTSVLNVLNGSSISHNTASGGPGGGIAATGTPTITVTNATLQDNTANTDGGAIHLGAGTLDFTGWWDVRWNRAGGNGGAVAVVGTGDAEFRVTDGAQPSLLAVNTAAGNGGALYVTNDDTVQLYATQGYALNLNTNQALGDGGAVYADNGAYFDVYGQVQASSNQAGGDGGVFYLAGGSRVWLDDYQQEGPQMWVNRADNGGAIYAQNSPSVRCDGAVFGTLSNGNQATAGSGGAIYLGGSRFSAENCIFRSGQATEHGGAIAAYTSTLGIRANYPSSMRASELGLRSPSAPTAQCNPLTDECSAFYDNTADSDGDDLGYGGALYANNSELTADYTTLHRNSAAYGGAIYQEGTNALGRIHNSLVYSNAVSTGGIGAGIRHRGGVFTVTHTTIAYNAGGAGFAPFIGTPAVVSDSIAWGNSGGGFAAGGTYVSPTCNIDQSGNVGTVTDPEFVSPGPGEDYHLLGSSPAINVCDTGLSPDLDNVPRPVASKYDMGAFEYAYGLEFAPDRAGTGLPGSDVIYTHTITNTGGTTDTFSLMASSSQGWSVSVAPTPGVTLAGGQSAPVTVSVSSPAGTLSGTVDVVVVTATSGADASLAAAVVDTTTVGFAPGVAFVPDRTLTGATPGQTYAYTHVLTNTGNAPDTFSLTLDSSAGWGAFSGASGPFTLDPNASTLVTVEVSVPPGGAGLVDTTVVTATSAGGAGPATVRDTTSAFTPGAAFTPDYARTVPVESVLTYTHRLTNTGNATDTFHLAWDSSLGWSTLLDPGPFTLAAGATQVVRLGVSVPGASAGLTDTTFITVTSTGGAAPVSVRDATAAYPAGATLTPEYTEMIQAGESITYVHQLANTGEYTDTFDLALSAGLGWATLLDGGPFTLAAGNAAELRVRVDAPLDSGGLTDTVVLEAASRASGALAADATNATIVARLYGVALTPPEGYSQSVAAGEVVTYTHQLANTGNNSDTFDLDWLSSRHWATLLDSGPFTLAAGAVATVRVRVEAPAGSGGLSEITRLGAASQLSPTVQASVVDTTTSIYVPGLSLTPDYAQSAIPPATVTYTHWLTNTGNGADEFALEFSSSLGWGSLATPGPFGLGAGEGISLSVRVDLPPGSGGLVDTGQLTATAQASGQSATVTDVTTATHVPAVTLVPDYTLSVPPGDTHVYLHSLSNAGNGVDTIAVTYTSSLGWATLLDSGPFSLGPGEAVEVRVSVQAPAGLISGTLTDLAVVTATSQADPGASAAVTDTTTVGFAPGAEFAPDNVSVGATEGDSFLYDHWLTNTANYTDSFVLTTTSSLGWGSLATSSPITLAPGDSANVQVAVSVPSGGANLADVTVVTATSQGGTEPLAVRDTTAAFEPSLAFTPDYSRVFAIGETFTYTHWLTNTAVTTDTVHLVLDSSRGWATLLDPGPFTLAAGAGITVHVQVTAPLGSGGLSDVARVTAAALYGALPSAYVTDTSSVPYAPGIELSPDYEGSADAGSAIVYAHSLTNTGNGPDTFTITLHSSQGWATLLDSGPFSLAAGERTSVRVEVSVPTDTYALTVDVTTLTATAESAGLSATAVDTTTVLCEALAGADFSFNPASPLPGQVVTFSGSVAAGSQLISYEWNWGDGGGVQSGNPLQHSFAAGDYRVLMTATNACSWVTATHDVAVGASYDVALSPGQALDAVPGESVILTHALTNTGNSSDSYTVTASSPQGWLAEYTPATTALLAPGQSATIVLTLSLPVATSGMVDTLSVRATSQADPSQQAVAGDTITAIPSVVVTLPITGPGLYTFGDTCASLNFASDADRGGLTAVTVTLVYSYPTLQLPPDPTRPLPRRYTIVGDQASGFTATLSLCYTQAEVDAAGIADENTLRLYRHIGAGTWVSYTSVVSTVAKLVSAEIHDLSTWAIGAPGHDPSVVSLRSAQVMESGPIWTGIALGVGMLWAAGWWVWRRRLVRRRARPGREA